MTAARVWHPWLRINSVTLLLWLAGCATAFEYPKTGQAWGQIVEGTPGKPLLGWTSQAACERAATRSWGPGPCFRLTTPRGERWAKDHWNKPSRAVFLWTSREACETPKWSGYTGVGDLGKRECRPIDLEPGGDFWVFSQVEWRTNWSGGAQWIGSDRREICDEYRIYVPSSNQSSDCVRVRVTEQK